VDGQKVEFIVEVGDGPVRIRKGTGRHEERRGSRTLHILRQFDREVRIAARNLEAAVEEQFARVANVRHLLNAESGATESAGVPQ
jgi:hypothetical protein